MWLYWDLYLLVNLILNAVLLHATAILAGRTAKIPDIMRGAALGTLYALSRLWVDLSPLFGGVGITLAALGMLWVTFRPLRPRDVILLFPLLVLAAAGGGLSLAMGRDVACSSSPSTGGGLLRLPVVAAFLLLVARVGRGWSEENARMRRVLTDVTVSLDGRRASFTALVDTGNRVVNPITGQPVVIVEHAAVCDIVPPEFARLAQRPPEDGETLSGLSDAAARRFCLIPFRSLHGAGELLPALRVDRLELGGSTPLSSLGGAVIAVTRERVSVEGRYQALIPPDLTE